MPYPRNIEGAVELEYIIRQGGAVPATIAIIRYGIIPPLNIILRAAIIFLVKVASPKLDLITRIYSS